MEDFMNFQKNSYQGVILEQHLKKNTPSTECKFIFLSKYGLFFLLKNCLFCAKNTKFVILSILYEHFGQGVCVGEGKITPFWGCMAVIHGSYDPTYLKIRASERSEVGPGFGSGH